MHNLIMASKHVLDNASVAGGREYSFGAEVVLFPVFRTEPFVGQSIVQRQAETSRGVPIPQCHFHSKVVLEC